MLAEFKGRNVEIRINNKETADSRAEKRSLKGELTAVRGYLGAKNADLDTIKQRLAGLVALQW